MSEPTAQAPAERLPSRVQLRPGTSLLRREPGRWQVGLGERGVVVGSTPTADGWLGSLRAGAASAPVSVEERAVAERLWRAGLLIDADAYRADTAAHPRLAAAAHVRSAANASDLLGRRHAARVGLAVDGGWRPELGLLLAENGLTAADACRGERPAVHLVAAPGQPDRRLIDALLGAGEPLLLVRATPAEVVVGPFVLPGRTACLRCEDAHRADEDPRWPVLVAQLPVGGAEPVPPTEPALLTLALAWAVRDLATFVEGGRPATWSATVTVDATLSLPRREWLRHPHCGCAWGDLLATG